MVCAGTLGLGCALGFTGGLTQYKTGVDGLASLPIYEYKNGQSILDGLNGKIPTGAPPLPMLPTLTGKGNGTTVTGDRKTNKRFHKTILQEFYQITFRKKLYNKLEELQKDLDEWLDYYNNNRTH